MFNFFKKFFKKEKLEIKLADLDKWFDESTKRNFEELTPNIKSSYSSFKEKIELLKEQIKALENAKIKDEEKIEPRVKQIVLGNRQNYIRQLNILINNLQIPEAVHKEALEFCSALDQKLTELANSTKKSFYTAQHLFHKEVEDIAKTIKDMDSIIKELRQTIEKSNTVNIDKTKEMMKELNNKIKAKKQLSEELETEEKNLNGTKEKKEETEKKIKELEKSKEFAELHNLKSELNSVNDSLRLKENELIQLFASMDRALKKFKRITLENEDLIEQYLISPAKALLKDPEFKIIDLIKKMKQPILENKIDLKDRKKEKLLKTIDTVTKEYLENFLSAYNEILENKKTVENKINLSTVMKQKSDLDYRLESYTTKLDRLNNLIEELKQKKSRIDIEKMKKDLVNSIDSITNIEVAIL
jgi:DNA repair exonuclease SbcCD ATPase subunit